MDSRKVSKTNEVYTFPTIQRKEGVAHDIESISVKVSKQMTITYGDMVFLKKELEKGTQGIEKLYGKAQALYQRQNKELN